MLIQIMGQKRKHVLFWVMGNFCLGRNSIFSSKVGLCMEKAVVPSWDLEVLFDSFYVTSVFLLLLIPLSILSVKEVSIQ